VPVAQMSGLPVYCVEWPQDKLPGVTARRAVQKALASVSAEHVVCYITRDGRQLAFTWARRRSDGKIELRTLPYEVGSPARTTIERLAEMAFSLNELEAGEPPVTAVVDKLNAAFSVEAVTQQFFADYQRIFADLQRRLLDALPPQQRSVEAKVWAHDYALQLLNRLMFLYFIQRKGWLGDNPRFLRHFWESYKRSGQPRDSFFSQWLRVLFFEAFNNKFHGGHRHFPEGHPGGTSTCPLPEWWSLQRESPGPGLRGKPSRRVLRTDFRRLQR
jgi:adenine-specific DNA-methyltransferase